MGETIKLTQEEKHEQCECLCYHCNNLQENSSKLNHYTISGRKGNSYFVDETFTIQLCQQCAQNMEIEKVWFDNEHCYNAENNCYQHEDYILNLIDTFPVANQEYVLNCYNSNFCSHFNKKRVSREDWIRDNS